jgi:signal transduction histidine kinase
MRAPVHKFKTFFNQWIRNRVVFPVLVLLAATVLWVSEETYDHTTSTLRGGIALTDSRVQSTRLLQLLTDAETAEYGFLLTGNDAFLKRFEQTQEELPGVQVAVIDFWTRQGPDGAALARQLAELSDRRFAQVARTLEFARAGDLVAATATARDDKALAELSELRELLNLELNKATAMQQGARVSIYDALLAGRVVVGVLTLTTLIGLFMFLIQIRRQDSASREERARLELEVKSRTARLTELARYFQSVREDERASVARELHDELGAVLTVSKLEIARARNKASQNPEVLASLSRVTASLDQGIALKRRIIEDLTPSALTHLGLRIALENLCKDMSVSLGVPVQLSVASFELSPAAQLAVYRFVQEALTNIGKYAKATEVTVTLTAEGDRAAVEVKDNGVGFDAELARAGRHGLSGMQFRAESLGGTMSVSSTAGKGTTLRIEFPQWVNSQ